MLSVGRLIIFGAAFAGTVHNRAVCAAHAVASVLRLSKKGVRDLFGGVRARFWCEY